MTVRDMDDVPKGVVMYLHSYLLRCWAAYVDRDISLASCIFSGLVIEKPFDTRHPSIVMQNNIIILS
jgi:hypothetical protein